jgi:tagatose-6-phosphate ketose/aldose isomerase
MSTFSPEQLEARGAGWTAREIAQQPAVWKETGRIVGSHRKDANAFLQPLLGRPDLRIVLTGAGTSAFVEEILAPALSLRLGRRVDAVATTDIVSNPNEYFAEDLPTLLVSFARSGNSPESVAATALADRCLSECHHLVLTCDPDGQLYTDHAGGDRSLVLLMPAATNDQGFAMTSSFTSVVGAAPRKEHARAAASRIGGRHAARRIHMMPEMARKMGPAWLDDEAVANFYPLYREPGRHVAALAAEEGDIC